MYIHESGLVGAGGGGGQELGCNVNTACMDLVWVCHEKINIQNDKPLKNDGGCNN
jgi:hypothetical protein